MEVIPKDKIKERMITKTAIRMLLDPEIVEKIVNFQGKDANLAVKQFKEVEFVGFGKFLIRKYKVERRIFNLNKGIEAVNFHIGEAEKNNYGNLKYLRTKLAGMEEQLKYYKSKLDE